MADNRTVDTMNIRVTADVSQAKQGITSLSNTSEQTMKKVANSIGNVRQAFYELPESVKGTTLGFKALDKNVVGSTSKFARLGSKIRETFMDKGLTKYSGEMADIQEQLRSINDEYSKLYASTKQYEATNNPQEGDRKFKERIERLQQLQQEYRATIQERNGLFMDGGAKTSLDKEFLSDKWQRAKGVVSSFSEKLTNLSDKTKEYGKRMLSALSPVKRFSKDNKDASLSANALAKALGKTWMMLKRLVTRMILRGMITSVREGFKNLAIYSDDVNNKISRIGASLIQLKNAFAVAFMPLISFVTPVLEKVIDLLSFALNKVGEFFSALTGKSSYIATLKPAYDYAHSVADSTKDTAKQTGRIKKHIKEIKNATIGIDNLNVIAPPDNNPTNYGGGNGGGGNTPNVADMFTTKKVSGNMKKIAKEVKKVAKTLFKPIESAWKKTQKYVISSWTNAGKSLLDVFKDIGRDFLKVWSQPQTQKIFENIFKSVGNIGGAVANLSKQFNKAWNSNKTGQRIFEAIRDVVLEVTKGIEGITSDFKDWVKTLDFKPLLRATQRYFASLKRVAKGVMTLIRNVNKSFVMPLMKWFIETAVPSLIDVFSEMNEKIDWQGIADNIGKITGKLEKFTEGFGEGFINFLKDLASVSATAINDLFGTDGAMTNFSNWLDGFDDSTVKNVGKDVGYLVGVFATLKFAMKGIKGIANFFKTIYPYLRPVVNGFKDLGKYMSTVFSALTGDWGAMGTLAVDVGNLAASLPMLPAAFDDIERKLMKIDIYNKIKGIFDGIWNVIWKFVANVGKILLNVIITPLKAFAEYYNLFAEFLNLPTIDIDYFDIDDSIESYKKAFKEGYDFYNYKDSDTTKKAKKNSKDRSKAVKEGMIQNNKAVKGFVSNFKTSVASLTPAVRKELGLTEKELAKIKSNKDVESAVAKMKKSLSELPPESQKAVSGIITEFGKIPSKKTFNVEAKANGKSLADVKKNIDKFFGKNGATIKAKVEVDKKKKFNFNATAVIKTIKYPKTEAIFKKAKNSNANVLNLTQTKKWTMATFADGGFPKLGSFFVAGEKGSELVGNINGKTGVASNQEITGIKSAIENQGGNETQLLIEQNRLLRALLEKEVDVVLDGKSITKTVNGINARSGKTLVTV